MYSKYKKPIQTIALILVVCVANGSVFAFLPDGNSIEAVQPIKLAAGVLNAFEASSVRVNGNSAQDGMTILSGADIKTVENSGATINIRQLGKIEINSESSVKLRFTAERIDLQVLSGQASLTAFKGVTGTLIDADGKAMKTDSTLETSSVGGNENVAVAGAPPPAPPIIAGGFFGMGFWGTAAIVGGVIGGTMLAVVAAAQKEDASEGPVSRVRP